jgi:hypothetical protein
MPCSEMNALFVSLTCKFLNSVCVLILTRWFLSFDHQIVDVDSVWCGKIQNFLNL